MINMFWKKLLILNLGLFIIIFRVFDLALITLQKNISNKSIFPNEDEDGYPFMDLIDCNIKNLFSIAYLLSNTSQQYVMENPSLKTLSIERFPECSSKTIFIICKGNSTCEKNHMDLDSNMNYDPHSSMFTLEDKNYHLNTNNDKFLWDYILSLNDYEGIEMEFLYKIFSGYQAYLNLLQIKEKNFERISKEVTSSYDKVNNLIYLSTLMIKGIDQIDDKFFHKRLEINKKAPPENKIEMKDDFIFYFYDKCLNESLNYLSPNLNNKIKEETFKIFDIIERSFACINDDNAKLSSIFDLRNIQTIIKIYFGYEIDKNEKKNLEIFIDQFAFQLNRLLEADVELMTKSVTFKDYQQYFNIFYIGLCLTVFLTVNGYFIKNKSKMKGKYFLSTTSKYSRRLNHLKNSIAKEQECKEKAQKQKQSGGIPYNSFSEAEKKCIDTLILDNDKRY